LLLSVAFTGGLFNFVDRCIPKEVAAVGGGVHYNVVLDYFSFTHMNTSS
jgi:lipoprotein signal peptidase